MTTRTPNTFIVGAGPVATALAGALRLSGVPVLGLWARNPAAGRTAAAVSGVVSYSSAPPDILLEADIIILAVSDHSISDVASTLVATGLITRKHIMLHCSGAMSSREAFAHVRDQIGGAGTLHPLRAIADGREAMRSLAGTVFGIEGDEHGQAAALALVQAIGGEPLTLSSEQMTVYHTAAAIASNFAVTLLDIAVGLLRKVGIHEREAIAALLPLAAGSLDNVTIKGLAPGLTGPIRRGDTATVQRHLGIVAEHDGLSELYRVLGSATVALARRNDDADSDALDAIARLLDG